MFSIMLVFAKICEHRTECARIYKISFKYDMLKICYNKFQNKNKQKAEERETKSHVKF